MLEYELDMQDNACQVRLSGNFDFKDNEKMEAIIERLEQEKASAVRLDLTGLSAIDSAGLGMIVVLKDEMEEAGASFAVGGMQGPVKKLFDLCRIDQLMTVEA